MTRSDRPSGPTPEQTPVEGYARAGLVYIDDSPLALQRIRRALYPHGLLVETFVSLEDFRQRDAQPIAAALLDVDLADGVSGLDAARAILRQHPHARVAFITAETSPERIAALQATGRVFSKETDLAEVVQWLLEAARGVGSRAESG